MSALIPWFEDKSNTASADANEAPEADAQNLPVEDEEFCVEPEAQFHPPQDDDLMHPPQDDAERVPNHNDDADAWFDLSVPCRQSDCFMSSTMLVVTRANQWNIFNLHLHAGDRLCVPCVKVCCRNTH